MAKSNEQTEDKKPPVLQKAVAKVADGVNKWWEELRIGDGHAAAMGRLGLAELRQALSHGHGSVEQPTGPGIFGAPTQGEIAEARDGPGAGSNQEGRKSTLSLAELRGYAAKKAMEAEKRMEHQNDRDRQRGGIER